MKKFKQIIGVLTAVFLAASMTLANTHIVRAGSNYKVQYSNVANNQKDVSRAIYFRFNFSGSIKKVDETKISFSITGKSDEASIVSFSSNIIDNSLVITPKEYLQPNTDYTLKIDRDAVVDNNDNTIDQDYIVRFVTRNDLTVKVGLDGDIPTIGNLPFYSQGLYIPRDFTEHISYLFEEGVFSLPVITLGHGNISFSGGYDSTFTSKGSMNDTVIISEGADTIFNIHSSPGDSDTKSFIAKFSFDNITFTENSKVKDSENDYNTAAPILATNSSRSVLELAIDKCAFKDLTDHKKLFAPIVLDVKNNSKANFAVRNTYITNNDFSNMYCGGILAISEDNSDTNLTLANNLIADNKGGRVGGIIVGSSDNSSMNFDMVNNTIANNSVDKLSDYGKAITANEDEDRYSGGVTLLSDIMSQMNTNLLNNIIWGNKFLDNNNDLSMHCLNMPTISKDTQVGQFSVKLDANDFGTIQPYSQDRIKFVYDKQYSVDPKFIDPVNKDYHLSSDSAMIDAGVKVDLNSDIENNVRPTGLGYDVGAYESQLEIKNEEFIISKSPVNVNEGDGHVTLTVQRIGGSSGEASVDYLTQDGTAIAGKDYTSSKGRLTFAAGETSKTISIETIDDKIVEQTESFSVKLENPSEGAKLGENSICTVNITDNDAEAPINSKPSLPNAGSLLNFQTFVFLGGLFSFTGIIILRKKEI